MLRLCHRRLWVVGLLILPFLVLAPRSSRAQEIAKYGAEFLAGGVGARAIGMGGAYVGIADDVTAGYWNAAGLDELGYPEIGYMHVERFSGVVSFDYAGGAVPVSPRSTIGLTAIRSGVNDIVNTLNAYNPETGRPKVRYENFLERFSAADYLFALSYARALTDRITVGLTGKVSRRTIGDFADAWGYSLDAGVQYRARHFALGLNVQDAFPYIQSWSVNRSAFNTNEQVNPETGEPYTYEETFGQRIPEGQTELVLPVARLGSGVFLPLDSKGSQLTVGLDLDVRFDGQRAYVPNLGDVSFQPRVGAELSYRGVVAVRAGINRVLYAEDLGLDLTPSVGAGFNLKQFSINYAFGDFGGVSSDLGYSHRISARLRLEQPGLKRGE